MIEEIDARKEKLKTLLTYGSMAGAALIAGVFYMLLIQTAVAIVAAGVAAVAGFSIVSFAPWVALKITNAKYRAIDAERVSHIQKVQATAALNPIETMQNLLMQKNKAFAVFKTSVENAITARDTFKLKCEKFAKKYPARAPEFQKQLDNMAKMVELKKVALRDAQQTLEDGALKLEEMQAYWEMSKDAQELNRAAGMDTGDVFEKLKADTACDAVFESMSRAFAQLEVAASLEVNSDDNSAPAAVQLSYTEPTVLEIDTFATQEKVKRGVV